MSFLKQVFAKLSIMIFRIANYLEVDMTEPGVKR